ncbi:MAG: ABC transporter permease [Azoarcus sp.]|jgi:ABC-2 type transport system permease protein|nr:ABC transporter permease [Azoarcus sp.]
MKTTSIRLAALWKKELLALSRDRMGLAALFVMPAIFILVLSLALADTISGSRQASVGFAVLDLDHTPLSARMVEGLPSGGPFALHAAPSDEAEARRWLAGDEIAFAVLIPPGFGAEISANRPPPLRFLLDPVVPVVMREGFQQCVELAATRVWLEHLLERLGTSLMLPQLRHVTDRVGPPLVTREAVGGAPTPSAVQQNVPAWLIFSMFFVVVPISAVFIGERQHGTLQRLATQRVSFALVLAGKFAPFVLVNQVQALAMVAVGRWGVPLMGGEALTMPEGAAALAAWWTVSLAVSVAAVGWALLIASLASTSEQATVFGGVSNILLGAVGGVMVPRFMMPATMQPLTRCSPMDWALEAFHDVMLRHGGFSDVLPWVAALLCFGVAALAVAAFLDRRRKLS